jgi:hypothetical protein
MEEKQGEEVGEEVEKELTNPEIKSAKQGFAYGLWAQPAPAKQRSHMP